MTPIPQISIRPSTPDDADQLADLAHELNRLHDDPTRPSPERLREHHGLYQCFVAEENQTLLGYVAGYRSFQFHTATPAFEIQNISIKAAYRRRGLGLALMRHIIHHNHMDGIRKFALGVENTNQTARAFYAKLGFTEKDFGSAKRCHLRDEDLDRFIQRYGATP